jgi:uncharacterized protein YjbI with pentapeptide repeats
MPASVRPILSSRPQHEGASVHALEPIPVLAEPGVAVGGGVGQKPEGGAAVGANLGERTFDRALRRRLPRGLLGLLAEQREGQLVARVQQRDGRFALARSVGDAPHLLVVGGVLRGDRVPPSLGFDEGLIATEARGREPAQICRDIVGDFSREAPAVREAAGMRVAVGGQECNAGHGSGSASIGADNLHRLARLGQSTGGTAPAVKRHRGKGRRLARLACTMCAALGVTLASAILSCALAQANPRNEFLAGRSRDCPRCDLAGMNFKRRDLGGADLTGANLKQANLHDARLAGARLAGANLTGANLNKANLSRAELAGAVLRDAMLYAANLDGANLAGADLSDALMGVARLTRADLSKAALRNVDLRKARLAETNLAGAELTAAALDFAFLRGARLDGASLKEARLIGAELVDASLAGADLTDANALGAQLRGADLSRAVLAGANFRRATMYETKLDDASFANTAMPDGTIRDR